MAIFELEGGLLIHRVSTPEEIARWQGGVVDAYQTVFSGFPYFERFYSSEAEGIYRKLTSTRDNITLVACEDDRVVGLSVAIPLAAKADVAAELSGLVPIAHTFYLAELGVLETHRGRGIGRTLLKERLRLIDSERYSHVVLRVSTKNTPSSAMYRAMSFEDMGVYTDVSAMRVDGQVRSDRRFFMSRVLSQVELD